MSKIVEVRVIDASLLPRLAPVPLQVHKTQFAAVWPAEDAGCWEHRARCIEVTTYCVNCRLGEMNDSAAAHLRFDDEWPATANFDDLALDNERACIEVDVTA